MTKAAFWRTAATAMLLALVAWLELAHMPVGPWRVVAAAALWMNVAVLVLSAANGALDGLLAAAAWLDRRRRLAVEGTKDHRVVRARR